MANTQSSLAQLTQWWGPQRKAISLTITEIPDGWGSQASLTGGIIQAAAAFRDADRLGELYHELTHLWNVADLDAPSPRWNEGLASFVEDLLRERVNGWTGRLAGEAQLMTRLQRSLAGDSTFRTTPFVDYGKRAITGRAYSVGELMFATLHALVGDETFHRIIAAQYRDFPNGITTRGCTERASAVAGRDLKSFFDDWVYTTRWTQRLATARTVSELAAIYR